MIATCGDWVANKQVRLKDGTLARNRPQAWSLWADDMYMGVPALAEMGHLTGQRKYFDDAVNNVLRMSHYMFNPQLNLYTHGWNANHPDAPQFYWGRANGWSVLAMSDLLDVLPKSHPGYPKVLAQLRKSLRGIAQYQSGAGLWHQMLDRNDSYLETSASAIFVYVIAHAINQGWVSPTTYGSIAQAGWNALSARINAQGQVEGTCVGTTFASDQVYYYNRPTSVQRAARLRPDAAGRRRDDPADHQSGDRVESRLRTYHYRPKDAAAAASDSELVATRASRYASRVSARRFPGSRHCSTCENRRPRSRASTSRKRAAFARGPFISACARLLVLRPVQHERAALVDRRHVVGRRILGGGREQVRELGSSCPCALKPRCAALVLSHQLPALSDWPNTMVWPTRGANSEQRSNSTRSS